MKNTRGFCLLLAILCVIPLSACAKQDAKKTSGTETTVETVPQVTTTPELQPNLPEKDFGGYEFRFLTRFMEGTHWAPWNSRDIYVENENGEIINDAVYQRNRFVEEKYNVKINWYSTADYAKVFQQSVMAGDDTFDVYYAGLNDMIPVAYAGYLHDLKTLPYVDLNQPWWDQNAVKSLSVGGKLYFSVNDTMIMNNDCTSAIVFNKDLIQDNGLENPYELVRNGKWTIDKIIAMSKDISRDIDGNGTMDYNDMYGFVSYRDASLSIMHSAGGRIAEKDEKDYPILTLQKERTFNALSKAFDLMYDEGSFNVHKELEGKFDAIYEVTEKMFAENRSLFYWILLHDVEKFRDMDADFGILPIPKFDDAQEEYGCTVNQYHGHAMAVPITNKDVERTGILMEALAAKSKYTLQPAYYDITLSRKVARDNESAEMLDIIFHSTVYDVGAIYNFGDFSWQIIFMTMSNNRDIASIYAKKEKQALKDIQKTIEQYQKLE